MLPLLQRWTEEMAQMVACTTFACLFSRQRHLCWPRPTTLLYWISTHGIPAWKVICSCCGIQESLTCEARGDLYAKDYFDPQNVNVMPKSSQRHHHRTYGLSIWTSHTCQTTFYSSSLKNISVDFGRSDSITKKSNWWTTFFTNIRRFIPKNRNGFSQYWSLCWNRNLISF